MNVSLPVIPHHRLGPLPIPLIPLKVDPQTPVNLQPQQHLVIHRIPPPRNLIPLHPLHLQLLQPRLQIRMFQRQPLCLDLRIARCFGGAELVSVEARDARGVIGAVVVSGGEVVVLGCEGGEMAGEFLEGGVGVMDAEVAGLLEGGEGLCDAGDGVFVWVDVEVVDGMGDELRRWSQ